jgi:pSer/pThr/pTyr-binding forkhead associated (FHA) protein
MKACAACGARNEERSLYCRDCGGRLAAPEGGHSGPGTTVTAESRGGEGPATGQPGTLSMHGALPPALAAAAAPTPVAPARAPTVGGACAQCGYALPVARSVRWCPGCAARLDGAPVSIPEDAVQLDEDEDDGDENIPVAAAPVAKAAPPAPPRAGDRTQTSAFAAGSGAAPAAPPVAPRPPAAPSTPPVGWELVLVRSGERVQRYPLRKPVTSLGAAADLSFEGDAFLSPVHARVTYRAPRLWLEDAGSANGVFLRVDAPAAIRHGDVLCLGSLVVRYEPPGEPPRPAAAAPAGGVRPLGSGRERPKGVLVRILADGTAGPAYPLTPSKTIVGRKTGHYVFPEDPLLSRQHAQFYERDGSMTVEDLGSSNGTLLRIREAMPLEAGAVFRIGDQTLEFHAL